MQDAPGSTRRPGRPRQSHEETARIRASVVDAAERVFAAEGYRAMTPARLIEAAGLTRTNFYRFFPNADAPLQEVLDRFASDLGAMIEEAVGDIPYGAPRVVAGIDAFLAWSLRYQHLLPAVMAGVHDPASPVSRTRRAAADRMIEILTRDYEQSDRDTVPDRTLLDIFVNGLEYTAYRLVLDTPVEPADVQVARGTMLRLAVALLGRSHTWREFADVVDHLERPPARLTPRPG